jgi:hypothetical protein
MSCAFASVALATAERWHDVARIVELALSTSERLSLLFMASFLRVSDGLAVMALGEPSRGIAAIEAIRDAPPSPLLRIVAEFALGVSYARIARGQVSAPVSVLLRNPGFVIRHGLPARRKARAILARIADDSPNGLRGYCGQAMHELALLHVHCGEDEKAATRAAQAVGIFESQGALAALSQSRQLLDSLGRSTAPA